MYNKLKFRKIPNNQIVKDRILLLLKGGEFIDQ